MSKDVSEIRRDPVSRDWVIIATGRAKRPDEFKRERIKIKDSMKDCSFCTETGPFEDLRKSGNEIIEEFTKKGSKDWWVSVIKNKYPAVRGDKCGVVIKKGPYEVQPGAGYHEVIITRDHNRSIAEMTEEEIEILIFSYQKRYEDLRGADCANFILIFHNHGDEAGASLHHPHSQIIAIPVIPSDMRHSLKGSERYRKKTDGGCIHCEMVAWERKEGKRIVYENEEIIVLSPYVPRTSFELRIYPKHHQPYFEKITPEQRKDLAQAMGEALGKLYVGLGDPAYNFFIHTAPSRGAEKYTYYHWHIEILPKTAIMAGFELGSGVEISAIDPDEAAEYLRKQKNVFLTSNT